MKKLKFILGAIAISAFALTFSTHQTVASDEELCMEDPMGGGCDGYKKKNCLFHPDTKCKSSGNDCGVQDPCGNGY
jgi:hypothetical protein